MTRGGGGGDTISKMPDVEESVPPKDPDDSEGRSCKPETSGPPQEDKSGPEDPPPSSTMINSWPIFVHLHLLHILEPNNFL
ncbi:TCP11 isoform 26 [Pongo abelii]|uniref:TCP11 isoform 26 n=1 Tax=Pongo abelii TaxID=9601 RepID=A0A2J8Y3A8_PONAB|nr:TCP11 isoform 26 [Pongo abelii]